MSSKFLNLFKKTPNFNDLQPIPDWEVVSRSYAAPRKDWSAINNLPDKIAEKALLGVTTYLWKDKNTGEFRTDEVLGNDHDELGDLCDKVDITGNMQIIRIDGKTYGLAKWAPPEDQLPIK